MSKEEDTPADLNQGNASNTLKKFRSRVAEKDDHFVELGMVGCSSIFLWSGIVFLLNLIFGWLGFFSALSGAGLYVFSGVFVGFMCCLILYYGSKSWFVGTLGYGLPLIGLAWLLFPELDPSINVAIHVVLSVLMLINSKRAISKTEREYYELRISSDLQLLLKNYELETLDSDLYTMLDEAVQDRIDIHEKIYLSNDHDHLLEEIGVLEDVDDALCTLLKQAKTIMQFREKVVRAEKEDSGASSDDQLHNKLNEQMHQFIQNKTVLHELTLDVLGIDDEQIALGIQALQNKREEVTLIKKTRRELKYTE